MALHGEARNHSEQITAKTHATYLARCNTCAAMNHVFEVPCLVTKITAIGNTDKAECIGKKQELCVVVRLPGRNGKMPIHAGASTSSAARQEPEPDAVLLLRMNTAANIGDMLEVEGVKLRVTHVEAVPDVVGKLDYYQVEATEWNRGDPADQDRGPIDT
jgi:hypothetical protein